MFSFLSHFLFNHHHNMLLWFDILFLFLLILFLTVSTDSNHNSCCCGFFVRCVLSSFSTIVYLVLLQFLDLWCIRMWFFLEVLLWKKFPILNPGSRQSYTEKSICPMQPSISYWSVQLTIKSLIYLYHIFSSIGIVNLSIF